MEPREGAADKAWPRGSFLFESGEILLQGRVLKHAAGARRLTEPHGRPVKGPHSGADTIIFGEESRAIGRPQNRENRLPLCVILEILWSEIQQHWPVAPLQEGWVGKIISLQIE